MALHDKVKIQILKNDISTFKGLWMICKACKPLDGLAQ